VRGDVVELHPSYEEFAYRIEFFGDEVTRIDAINPLTGETLMSRRPGVHLPGRALRHARGSRRDGRGVDREELDLQVMRLRGEGKLLEAQRLLARTKYDIEMILEVGVCSRHRKLQPPSRRPKARAKSPTRCSIISPRIFWSLSTNRT
jgi:excinuclease ABC subunit B